MTVNGGGGTGISVRGSFNNVSDVVLSRWYSAITIYGNNNNIKNIISKDAAVGVFTYGSYFNNISNITITGASTGLDLSACSSNNITNSIIQALYGIIITGNSENNLIYNNILNGSSKNVYFPYSSEIYLNNWSVTKQSGVNIWNSSLGYIGGNVWTNPSGTGYSDTCADTTPNDGFCDSPYTVDPTGPNIDYLPIKATPLPIAVSAVSPLTGSVIIGRAVKFNYNVTWTSLIPPLNCSVFDNRTGVFAYSKSNSTPLINNSVANNITFTYPQDYDLLSWYVQCCYAYVCFSSYPPRTIAVHTSQINASAYPVDSRCLNAPVYFYCNYTDGNNKSVQPALVNITVWNATSTYLYTNDQNVPDNSSVSHGVLYNSTLQMFYYKTSSLPLGKYNYSCSALNVSYPFNQSGNYNYTITDLTDSKLTVTTYPDYQVQQQNGQTFYFNGSYTDQSGTTVLDNADCKLIIYPNGAAGGMIIQAYYNSNVQLYQANTTSLMIGPNPCNFTCTQTCYRTASNLTTFIVTYGGLSSSPALVFEDPVYSLQTHSTAHKVITQSPYSGSLVSNISKSASGWNWTYGMVVKISKPQCAALPSDKSKILLVKDSTNIYDTGACPAVNSFAGVIFEDNLCGSHLAQCNLNKPYAYNFPTGIYDKIPDSSYVLLNGDDLVVQDISKLRNFYFNGYYRANNYAPSFLMRLSGQLTCSPYGIESFVNINTFTQNISSVDYNYFNSSSPANQNIYKIKGMPNCENSTICSNDNIPHFFLDNEYAFSNVSGAYTHVQSYGADNLTLTPLEPPQQPPGGTLPPEQQCTPLLPDGCNATCNCSVMGHPGWTCSGGACIPPTSPGCVNPNCNDTCHCSNYGLSSSWQCVGGTCQQQCTPPPACNVNTDCASYGANYRCCYGGTGCGTCTPVCLVDPDCPAKDCNIPYCNYPGSCPPSGAEECSYTPTTTPPYCSNPAGSCNNNNICETATENYYRCFNDCCWTCQGIVDNSTSPPGTDNRCHQWCQNKPLKGCPGWVDPTCEGEPPGYTTCNGNILVTCCRSTIDCNQIQDIYGNPEVCVKKGGGAACVSAYLVCGVSMCNPGEQCCDCSSDCSSIPNGHCDAYCTNPNVCMPWMATCPDYCQAYCPNLIP